MIKYRTIMSAALMSTMSFTAYGSDDNVSSNSNTRIVRVSPKGKNPIIATNEDLAQYNEQMNPEADPAAENGPKGDLYRLPPEVRKMIIEAKMRSGKCILGVGEIQSLELSLFPVNQDLISSDKIVSHVESLLSKIQEWTTKEPYLKFIGKTIRMEDGSKAFIPTEFDATIAQFHPMGYGQNNKPATIQLISCINSMVSNSHLNPIMGVQAASLIMNPFYWQETVQAPHPSLGQFYSKRKKDGLELINLKSKVADRLEAICLQALPKNPMNELNDVCYSLMVRIIMSKYPCNRDDVRRAASYLTKIKDAEYFKNTYGYTSSGRTTVYLKVLEGLIVGAKEEYHSYAAGVTVASRLSPQGEIIKRTHEQKVEDFIRLGAIWQYAKHNLGMNVLNGGVMAHRKDILSPLLPIVKSKQQAEIFIDRHINEHFVDEE